MKQLWDILTWHNWEHWTNICENCMQWDFKTNFITVLRVESEGWFIATPIKQKLKNSYKTLPVE